MSKQEFEQAKAAINAGDKATGRRLLMNVLNENPRHEMAWYWMAWVVSDLERQRRCFETVLEINPNNEQAKAELLRLQAREMLQQETDTLAARPPDVNPSRIRSTMPVRQEKSRPSLARDSIVDAADDLGDRLEHVLPPSYVSKIDTFGERLQNMNRGVLIVGCLLLLWMCSGILRAFTRDSGSVTSRSGGSSSQPVEIPPTYSWSSPSGSGSSSTAVSGSSRSTGSYGDIAVGKGELADYAEYSSLGMSFYRDLEYTDGTYQHTMCTSNCEHKLVMRSETYDRDDLDNFDYSFAWSTEDDLTVGGARLLSVLSLAVPDWEGSFDWFIQCTERYLEDGRGECRTTRNGVTIELLYDYSAVEFEEIVLLGVQE